SSIGPCGFVLSALATAPVPRLPQPIKASRTVLSSAAWTPGARLLRAAPATSALLDLRNCRRLPPLTSLLRVIEISRWLEWMSFARTPAPHAPAPRVAIVPPFDRFSPETRFPRECAVGGGGW